MPAIKTPGPAATNRGRDFWLLLACLLAVLVGLFHNSLLPQYVIFNNDGPPAANLRAASHLPDTFSGQWMDLNWLGLEWPKTVPDMSMLFLWLAGPVVGGNLWPAMTLMILGLSAWFFFRQSKMSATAAVLGGLAAALHSGYFSNACWGQVSRPLTLAWMFVALGLLQKSQPGVRSWVATILAGMAVGMGVMEGSDIGALFSLVVALYIVVAPWFTGEATGTKTVVHDGFRVLVVALCAGLISAQAISGLVGTQIQGVAGTKQDDRTKQEQWDWATQWSVPKAETLGLIVPGLFGYRMDSPDGGNYWGKMGRDASWDRYYASGEQGSPPPGFRRFSGGNDYAGSLIILGALWALFQSFRKRDAIFTIAQKRFIWFWGALAFVSLLLALGRFSLFYNLFYALPYASTIRSPAKFIGIFDWAFLILFAYGMHGLSQRLGGNLVSSANSGLATHLKSWWTRAAAIDRRWIIGSAAALAVSVLGWLIYASENNALQDYLKDAGFDADQATSIAGFSIRQVGWFILFLTLALISIALVMSGWFAGRRAKMGATLLGIVLVADLCQVDYHWIVYFDYDQKYASNPVIDTLRDRPYEHRVAILPGWIPSAFQLSPQATGAEQYLDQLYNIEWAQHHFQRYDVQSLDLVQMSRRPEDFVGFESAMMVRSGATLPLLTRRWELTNTRYILGLAGFADLMNHEFDPVRQSFHVAEYFNIVPKPGVDHVTRLEQLTAETNSTGPYALIEFGGALPRAKLYANWQVSTNDDNALKTLADPAFDPQQQVVVDTAIAPPAVSTNQDAGTVDFKDYAPKHITLQAQAATPAVLLLNDRYADNWKVRVDGKPGTLLRCNYLMRGVRLDPGAHTVEFIFQPPIGSLWITIGTEIAGVLLLAGFIVTQPRTQPAEQRSPSGQRPSSGSTTEEEQKTKHSSAKTSGQADLPKDVVSAMDILGIKPPTSWEDIKSAYRLKMKEYHPDKVASLGEKLRTLAEKESKQVNSAYDLLTKHFKK